MFRGFRLVSSGVSVQSVIVIIVVMIVMRNFVLWWVWVWSWVEVGGVGRVVGQGIVVLIGLGVACGRVVCRGGGKD